MALPAALRPLRHRTFALVLGAGLISNIGTWMETIAVASLVRAATGRDTWVAIVAAAAFLPIGLLSPVGGALADRWDRRRFILIANLVEAALAGTLATLAFTDRASPGAVVAVVAAAGCSAALRIPFQQAILPDLVPPEDLLAALALGSAQYNSGRIVGPALAAAVIAGASFGAAFTVNTASFFAVVGALLVVRIPKPVRTDDQGIVGRIADGVRASRRQPSVRTAISLVAVCAVLISPFIALIASRAAQLVDGSDARALARAAGVLTTAQGVGAVAGSLIVPTLAERFGRRPVLLGSLVATPAAVVLYAIAPDLWSAAAALAAVGAAYTAVLTGLSTVVQLKAPEGYRGRVLSLYLVALGTLYPVGALVQGAVADAAGLATATAGGALLLLLLLGGVALFRPALLRHLDTAALGTVTAPPVTDTVATPS